MYPSNFPRTLFLCICFGLISCVNSGSLTSKIVEPSSQNQIDNIYYISFANTPFMVSSKYLCDSSEDYYEYNKMTFECKSQEIDVLNSPDDISSHIDDAKSKEFNYLIKIVNTDYNVIENSGAGFSTGNVGISGSTTTVSSGINISLIRVSDQKVIWRAVSEKKTSLIGQDKEVGISLSKMIMKKLREDGFLSKDFYMPRVIY